jgi:hypothetical protein
MWIGFIGLRIGTGGCCENGDEPSGNAGNFLTS